MEEVGNFSLQLFVSARLNWEGAEKYDGRTGRVLAALSRHRLHQAWGLDRVDGLDGHREASATIETGAGQRGERSPALNRVEREDSAAPEGLDRAHGHAAHSSRPTATTSANPIAQSPRRDQR